MPLSPGTRLGPYEISGPLGAGGMGEVYSARDTRLDRIVAIKVLPADLARDADARARFDREARSIAALSHPNICALYDVGHDQGHDYLVMEMLEGETLQQRLDRGPMELAQVVDYAIALTDALDAAHARSVIHRDLKPANIFLTSRGHLKVLDFGLAKAVEPASDVTRAGGDMLTTRGTTVGTVAYMSPEQLRGETLDQRTDLFSLGIVLYEMAAGTRAFAGPTPAVVSAAILTEEPTTPSRVRPGLPPRLDDVIMKALEKDRALRSQSAAELRADFARLRREIGSSGARAAQTPAVPAPISPPAAVPATVPVAMPAAIPPVSMTTTQAPAAAAGGRIGGSKMAMTIAIVVLIAIGYYLGLGQSNRFGGRPFGRSGPDGIQGPMRPGDRGGPGGPGRGDPSAAPGRGPVPPAPATAPAPPSEDFRAQFEAFRKQWEEFQARGNTPAVPEAPVERGSGEGEGTGRDSARGLPPAARGGGGGGGGGGRARGGGGGRPPGGRYGGSLIQALRGFPPQNFELAVVSGNARSLDLAVQLRAGLENAGWTCTNVTEIPMSDVPFAIFSPPRSAQAATAFNNWARRNGIEPDFRITPQSPGIRIVIGAQ